MKKKIFFYPNCFEYDIVKCHYSILKKIDKNLVKNVEFNNKIKRNIKIGKLFKSNQKLSKLVHVTVNSIIDQIIFENKIEDSELILRQHDGVIVSKKLEWFPESVELILKNEFELFLFSFDQKRYLAKSKNKSIIKGIPNRYKEIDKFLNKICTINFLSKMSIFNSLKAIKAEFFSTEDLELFLKPENEDKFSLILKKYGKIILSKNAISLLDINEIDKDFYFQFYLKPFYDSIILTFC